MSQPNPTQSHHDGRLLHHGPGHDHRRRCATDRACLLTRYVGALETLVRYGSSVPVPAWVNATDMAAGSAPDSAVLPVRVGQCTTTQVRGVAPRVGGGSENFETGTEVKFANGGYQVSYDRVDAIISSRPGDRALMCLTTIPRNCPPGDARGRFYTVTNLRTHASWSLPDAQHLCGGA